MTDGKKPKAKGARESKPKIKRPGKTPAAGTPAAEDAAPEPVDPTSSAALPDAKPVEANPVGANPVDANPVDANPVDANPVDAKPVDANPVDANPVDANPVDANPIDVKPIDASPVDAKPIDANLQDGGVGLVARPDVTPTAIDSKPVDDNVQESTRPQVTPTAIDARPVDAKPVDATLHDGGAGLPARPDSNVEAGQDGGVGLRARPDVSVDAPADAMPGLFDALTPAPIDPAAPIDVAAEAIDQTLALEHAVVERAVVERPSVERLVVEKRVDRAGRSPAAAALEAARIVSEMIDIDTPTGAVIAATAAVNAAIEVRRGELPADSPISPLTTVRLSRDRILKAIEDETLAENEKAAAAPIAAAMRQPRARTEPGAPRQSQIRIEPGGSRASQARIEQTTARPSQARIEPGAPRASSEGSPRATTAVGDIAASGQRAATSEANEQLASSEIEDAALGGAGDGIVTIIPRRAATEPGIADEDDDEFDPVQIAAAAISRLRKRAKTDLAELRGHYHRHDIFVVLLAFVIIVIAGRVHEDLVTPPNVTFSQRGLKFEHSQAWLTPEPVPLASPRLLRDERSSAPPSTVKDDTLYHVEFTSTINPSARIEVLIDKKPAWSNIVTGLDLDRRTRWGELYKLDDSSVRDIEGHDWLRTAYRFAHAADKGDVPRVDLAIEYATKDKDQLYVITLYGSAAEIARIEEVVAPSLRVATNVGLQIEPQTNRLSRRNYPNAVSRAFDSTVMVVAADLVDGRLKPRGGGSGVIVGGDGSILTNYHVIHDKDGRLHDVFIIGRFAEPDHAPQLQCAGRPSRSKLQRDLDLALIKCDLDLDGRAWNPATSTGVWATLPESRTADVKMGQRLWVLGYPDVGGGGLTLSQGEVGGWTGVDGAQGKDFIKTDAAMNHGNSGGPVVDDQGRLVGIAAAFRTRITASGGVIESTQVGLVRPLSVASDLLAIAAAGWTPRENRNDVELTPSAVEAPSEGVRISTKIVDAANEAPIGAALVMVLKPGLKSGEVDVNRLDDQVLSWGRSNTQGEVLLKQPVPIPGTYSVMVVARGYEPLIGRDALVLDAKTPPSFDPWGKIWLRSR